MVEPIERRVFGGATQKQLGSCIFQVTLLTPIHWVSNLLSVTIELSENISFLNMPPSADLVQYGMKVWAEGNGGIGGHPEIE
jgi:hypothetical protein